MTGPIWVGAEEPTVIEPHGPNCRICGKTTMVEAVDIYRCPEHGEFWIEPGDDHQRFVGNGPTKIETLTMSEYIDRYGEEALENFMASFT